MSDRLKLPPERDLGFYQRRKHDAWRAVEPPALEAPVIDTHAHIHMLPDPAWELYRCVSNGVEDVCEICDPSEDELSPDDDLVHWRWQCATYMMKAYLDEVGELDPGAGVPPAADTADAPDAGAGVPAAVDAPIVPDASTAPYVHMAAGVHPHNARLYDEAVERKLLEWLASPRVVALGEIGLDYHYDLSPRDVQRCVFRRQIALAKELGLPIALHLRGGDDPVADDAHAEAFAILQEEGFPQAGTLLHCCALPPDQLKPWIEADCYIAYGGALTFKNGEAAREGARLVPANRLLLETDSPYMTPEPMRGAACTPAHVIFTAACLAEVRGCEPGVARQHFLEQVTANSRAFFAARSALQ